MGGGRQRHEPVFGIETLHFLGCRPEESSDGKSALAILWQAAQSGAPFRIALLDVSLPGIDGEELGKWIAADPQLQQTVLVLMTVFGRQKDVARLQTLGFAGHVSKPIWKRSLRETMLRLGTRGGVTLSPVKRVSQAPSLSRRNGQARILVAEDNLTNQQVALALLKKLGYHADVVATGVEAL